MPATRSRCQIQPPRPSRTLERAKPNSTTLLSPPPPPEEQQKQEAQRPTRAMFLVRSGKPHCLPAAAAKADESPGKRGLQKRLPQVQGTSSSQPFGPTPREPAQ